MTGLEVFCVGRKDRPDSLAPVFLGIILPAEREAPAFGFDSQMLSIPSAKLLGIFRFEENPTDAGNFFHNVSPRLVAGSDEPSPTINRAEPAECIPASSACASSSQSRCCRAAGLCYSRLRPRPEYVLRQTVGRSMWLRLL